MHAKYYNEKGNPVPSVTTVLKILYKDGLLEWANFIGRRGIDYKRFLEEKANLGSLVHEMIESDLLQRDPIILTTPAMLKEASAVAQKFKVAKEALKISNVITELSLSSERFGGTLDLIADIDMNGEPVTILGDFKTSKKPYLTQFIQLGAYLDLVKINRPEIYEKIQFCIIFSITSQKVTMQYVTKENCEKYFTRLFYSLLDTYTYWEEIKRLEPTISNLKIY